MPHTLIRVFDTFSNAENARRQLLDAGFGEDEVHLVSQNDEGGAMQGNFSVGNVPSGREGSNDAFSASSTSPNDTFDQTYSHDYANASKYGNITLTVDARDEDRQALASNIMQRFGAADVDDRAARH